MKKIRGKIYVHKSAVSILNSNLKFKIESSLPLLPSNYEWNIVRLETNSKKTSFLNYPNFENEPHPKLLCSCLVNLDSNEVKMRNTSAENPPILHRKETFLDSNDKNYEKCFTVLM